MDKGWYGLASDGDGHTYVIPEDKYVEFGNWLNSSEAADGCDPPNWAVRVDSEYSVVFPVWREING